MNLVLVTWNVHGWVGRDGVRDPGPAFDVMRELDADVVALQEVEGGDWPARAEAAGYRPLLGPTRGGSYGNALLVRPRALRLRRHDLSVPGREPRGALDAVLETPAGPLRVVATHLGLRASERRVQARRLAHHLGDGGVPVALLGDLNDWTPWAEQLRPLSRAVGPLSRIPTFPSRRPTLPLDRAAWRAPRRSARIHAIRTLAARRASDHLPLRLELAAEGEPAG